MKKLFSKKKKQFTQRSPNTEKTRFKQAMMTCIKFGIFEASVVGLINLIVE
jgi:hypothetical protein